MKIMNLSAAWMLFWAQHKGWSIPTWRLECMSVQFRMLTRAGIFWNQHHVLGCIFLSRTNLSWCSVWKLHSCRTIRSISISSNCDINRLCSFIQALLSSWQIQRWRGWLRSSWLNSKPTCPGMADSPISTSKIWWTFWRSTICAIN